MGKKRKDTDYVYLSTRVKAMERGLLDRARAERVLAAPTEEAAARVLQECGYPDLAGVTGRALEAALAQLGLDRDSVSVTVLAQAKSGFLGIGARPDGTGPVPGTGGLSQRQGAGKGPGPGDGSYPPAAGWRSVPSRALGGQRSEREAERL